MMTWLFRQRIMKCAHPATAGCVAVTFLMLGAVVPSAAAQQRVIEQLPLDLPLQQPGASSPPPSTEVNEPPFNLPPGGEAVPFAPPPAPSTREQEALHKRLDDGYKGRDEAIRAMLDPTRIRLLSGYADADEAAKALYANGAEVAEELKLTPGVALTKEQVTLLRKDIIWQVRIKKNGQELLVPRLYVAKGRIQKNDD